MSDKNTDEIICKGSMLLGTGCGTCSKCKNELEELHAENKALREKVRDAVWEYYEALDNRQHGGIAAGKALNKIQDVLGMCWKQGITTN